MTNDELDYSVVELEYQEDDDTVEQQVSNSLLSSNLRYPCVILKGVTIMEELDFLKNMLTDDNLALPLFVEVFDKVFELGKINITHSAMLSLPRSAIDTYELLLAKSETDIKKLDVADVNVLKKIIKLN